MAQRGDRALGKIRGDTLLTHSRTPHAVTGCLAVVTKYSRASGSAVSAGVPSLSRVSSRFFALNDLGLSGLPHLAPSSQHGTLNRSRFLLAPPTIPRQFSSLSATRTAFRRFPQERVGLTCAHVPRSPSLWRVQARFRHALMRFVKPARGSPSCSALRRVTPVTPSPNTGGEPALARLAAALRATVPADACG